MVEERKFLVAAVQASPEFPLSKKATTVKACRLIEEAGKERARLIVFPECYIPMFPNWAIDTGYDWAQNLKLLTQESVVVPGPETKAIGEAAKKVGAYVVIGVNERVGEAKLHNTAVIIGPDGQVIGRHRKLTPVFREKVFHASGTGADLRVFDTELGKLGALICYEHLTPIFKYALIAQGEQIHCALWPGWPHHPPPGRTNKQVIDAVSRTTALEGQCFVIISSMCIPEEKAEEVAERSGIVGSAHWGHVGGSGIVNPTGDYLAGPAYNEETTLYAEINLDDIIFRKSFIDVVGRDARWDAVNLNLNEAEYVPIVKRTTVPTYIYAPQELTESINTLITKLDRFIKNIGEYFKRKPPRRKTKGQLST